VQGLAKSCEDCREFFVAMTFKTLPTALLLLGTLGFAVCGSYAAAQATQNAATPASTKHKASSGSKSGSPTKSSGTTKTTSAGKSTGGSSSKSASAKSSGSKSSGGSKSASGKSTSGKSGKHSSKSSSSHAPGQKAPTPERITEIQQALAKNGALSAEPSGKWDDSTVEGMRKFQAAHGLNPSGKLDALTLRQLGLGSATAGLAAPSPTVKTSSASTLPADMQPQ
jgi:hypothetical protein